MKQPISWFNPITFNLNPNKYNYKDNKSPHSLIVKESGGAEGGNCSSSATGASEIRQLSEETRNRAKFITIDWAYVNSLIRIRGGFCRKRRQDP